MSQRLYTRKQTGPKAERGRGNVAARPKAKEARRLKMDAG